MPKTHQALPHDRWAIGYHSTAVVMEMEDDEARSYIPEKQTKGRRRWEGKAEEQRAVYGKRQSNYRLFSKRDLWLRD